MSLFSVYLLIVSTFMHAGWNLLAKQNGSQAAFFRRMMLLIAAAGAVPAWLGGDMAFLTDTRVLVCGLASGLFGGLYFVFLAEAYRMSDFSTVYPLARALPVLLVALGDLAWGRYPTVQGWLGILLVFFGCLLAPLDTFRYLRRQDYLNLSFLMMLLTALCTVGYTLLDKYASEVIPAGPQYAAGYGYLFFAASFVSYEVLWRLRLRNQQPSDAPGWRKPLCAGVLCFAAYWLVLWVYQTSANASYVVAFRQFSIVIGVLLASLVLKERGFRVRLTGTLAITSGLILIGVGGG